MRTQTYKAGNYRTSEDGALEFLDIKVITKFVPNILQEFFQDKKKKTTFKIITVYREKNKRSLWNRFYRVDNNKAIFTYDGYIPYISEMERAIDHFFSEKHDIYRKKHTEQHMTHVKAQLKKTDSITDLIEQHWSPDSYNFIPAEKIEELREKIKELEEKERKMKNLINDGRRNVNGMMSDESPIPYHIGINYTLVLDTLEKLQAELRRLRCENLAYNEIICRRHDLMAIFRARVEELNAPQAGSEADSEYFGPADGSRNTESVYGKGA